MTYGIYFVHPQTLSINFRSFYGKYDIAAKYLRSDVEEYIKTYKNVRDISYINKKKDIDGKANGHYLKISNKYPNRIAVYEKTSTDVGYIFSSIVPTVKKIMVFSMTEIDIIMPENGSLSVDVAVENRKKYLPQLEVVYMEELKNKLLERFGDMKKID